MASRLLVNVATFCADTVVIVLCAAGAIAISEKADLPIALNASGPLLAIQAADDASDRVRTGDSLLAINGVQVRSLMHCEFILDRMRVGDSVHVTIRREGTLRTASLRLVRYYDVWYIATTVGIASIYLLLGKHLESDRVLGLDLGADDYLTKPFSIHELLARIRALLRRAQMQTFGDGILTIGALEIDRTRQVVRRDGIPAALTAREFRILLYFLDHPGEVVTRQMLLDEVWGYDSYPTTRTVDNYILSLRKKIEPDHAHPEYIMTVHTAGYRFVGLPV